MTPISIFRHSDFDIPSSLEIRISSFPISRHYGGEMGLGVLTFLTSVVPLSGLYIEDSDSGAHIMSMHPSLKAASKIATKRNVLKRYERIDLLKKRGQWKEGDRAFGLRKTKPEEN